MYQYKAKIISVYDGDTVTAVVDLGFHLSKTVKLRLARIDTPEMRGSAKEKKAGRLAKQFVVDKVLNKDVFIRTSKTGKFGRFIAEIDIPAGENFMPDPSSNIIGVNLNDWLVGEGLAKYYK